MVPFIGLVIILLPFNLKNNSGENESKFNCGVSKKKLYGVVCFSKIASYKSILSKLVYMVLG